jgi:hypothetical protein
MSFRSDSLADHLCCTPVRNSVRVLALFLFALMFYLGAAGHEVARADEFRLPDDRPILDRAKLESCGLRILESRHLILVTDAPVEEVRELPPLADALFVELQRQLGALKAALDGKDFQITGYLIDAKERFEAADVLPPESVIIRHGRHIGYQFWMNNQSSPYYRRHLLLHEFIHCFMMCEHGMADIPPLWYTEGIAEYFATHELAKDIKSTRFGVLPASLDGYEGWGRIAEIRKSLKELAGNPSQWQGRMSLESIRHPDDNNFTSDLQYAQAWALVWLIRNHPELKSHFSALSTIRTRSDFREAEKNVPAEVWQKMARLWPLFLNSLTERFEMEHSFPPLNFAASKPFTLQSNKEWQNTGVTIKRGSTVQLNCTGRYAVHDQPRPWISEPQGITIDYVYGRPLGEITAMLVAPDGSICSGRIPIGRESSLTASFDSDLWLQINDSADSRSDNSGSASVEFQVK